MAKSSYPDGIGAARTCYALTPPNVFNIKKQLNQVFQSGMLSNFGEYNTQLEAHFQAYLGVRHALTISSASTALDILASTLPKDSAVIVPSFTFPSTINAAIHAGLTPVFADIEEDTYNICPADAERMINGATSAIIPINCFGNPSDVNRLQKIAAKADIKLFFDSAAALGAKYQNHLLGSFGDAEVFSLSGNKIITAGEGGLITTNNDALATRIRCLRNYGYSHEKEDCLVAGFNGKMSEINAILALWGLDELKDELGRRKELVDVYKAGLKSITGVRCQKTLGNCSSNHSFFIVRIDESKFGMTATELAMKLHHEGIQCQRYFQPLHKTSAFAQYACRDLPNTERLSASTLCLPLHSKLSTEDVIQVCRTIKRLRRSHSLATRPNDRAPITETLTFQLPAGR